MITRQFSTRSNIAASIVGNGIVAAAYLVSIPLYLPYIGVEAYGLVGLFVALQTVLTVLDFGLSVTLNREFAIRVHSSERSAEMRDLLLTSETITWSVSAAIALIGVFLAPVFASGTNPQEVSFDTVRTSFVAMGFALALHFPTTLYSGGMYGMQRQALLSAIFVVFSVLKTLGALAILGLISPTPQAFFIWQAVCAGLHSVTLAAALRLVIPKSGRARFRSSLLKGIWRFTAGIGAITVLAAMISQIDKLILVRVLSLEAFGYYSIAAVLSANVQRLVQPVYQAYFPKLSQAVNLSESRSLSKVYHKGSQLIAVIVLPVCAVFVFFSPELMFLWQRDATTVTNTWLTVSLLMIGSGLNGLLFLPYALQLAHGWTKLQVVSQLSAAFILIPLTIVLATRYGGPGAAIAWIIFNIGFLLVTVPIMHTRLLENEKWKWYLNDVAAPLAAATATASVFRLIYPETGSEVVTILWLAVAYATTLVTTSLSLRDVRMTILAAFLPSR